LPSSRKRRQTGGRSMITVSSVNFPVSKSPFLAIVGGKNPPVKFQPGSGQAHPSSPEVQNPVHAFVRLGPCGSVDADSSIANSCRMVGPRRAKLNKTKARHEWSSLEELWIRSGESSRASGDWAGRGFPMVLCIEQSFRIASQRELFDSH
ncbi:hypothetical protein FQN55_001590, partial [Onygenales sp. PD_40]